MFDVLMERKKIQIHEINNKNTKKTPQELCRAHNVSELRNTPDIPDRFRFQIITQPAPRADHNEATQVAGSTVCRVEEGTSFICEEETSPDMQESEEPVRISTR